MHNKTIFHSDRAIIVETHLHNTKVLLVSQSTSINHISQFENPQAHLRFQKQHETEFFTFSEENIELDVQNVLSY